MRTKKWHPIASASILTVLICGSFWLYVQWDNRRFEAALPSVAFPGPEGREMPRTLGTELGQEAAEIIEDFGTVSTPEEKRGDTTPSASDPKTVKSLEDDYSTSGDPLDTYLEFLEHFEGNPFSSGDVSDVSQEAPYDQEFTKAGFDDYNAYLATDPEYAYQRLEEAFQEQYGDTSDVQRLVEFIRLGNEDGAVSLEDAIAYQEVMRRLISNISPPEALEGLDSHLDTLYESQLLGLESGMGVTYKFEFIIGE